MSNQLDTAINIGAITLTNHGGDREADIKNQVLNMDLFESILFPVMYGEIRIYDTSDLLGKFPIRGEENIQFTFKSNSGDERKIKMKVFGIKDRIVNQDKTAANYTLQICSPELFLTGTLMYRTYQKQIGDIIRDLISDITDKDIKIEDTKGIENAILAELKPLQAIDYMRRRAVSPEYKSSSFCFFENKDGFNFKTLEGMFSENKDRVGDKIWYLDNNSRHDITSVSYRNIFAYSHPKMASTLENIAMGGLKNSSTSYDIITGEVKKKIFEDPDFESPDKLKSDLNSSTFKEDFLQGISTSFFTFTDASLPETELPEKLSYIQSFTTKITQNILQIWVPGDSTVSVGDVCKVNIPNVSDIDETQKEDRLYSGNYLIAKVRHMFTFNSGDESYTMSMELIKGALLG